MGSDSTPLLAVPVYAKALFDLLPALDPARPAPHDVPANGSRVVNRLAAVVPHPLPQDRHGGLTTASAEPVDSAGHLLRLAARAPTGHCWHRGSRSKPLTGADNGRWLSGIRGVSGSSSAPDNHWPLLPDAGLLMLDQPQARWVHAPVVDTVSIEAGELVERSVASSAVSPLEPVPPRITARAADLQPRRLVLHDTEDRTSSPASAR